MKDYILAVIALLIFTISIFLLRDYKQIIYSFKVINLILLAQFIFLYSLGISLFYRISNVYSKLIVLIILPIILYIFTKSFLISLVIYMPLLVLSIPKANISWLSSIVPILISILYGIYILKTIGIYQFLDSTFNWTINSIKPFIYSYVNKSFDNLVENQINSVISGYNIALSLAFSYAYNNSDIKAYEVAKYLLEKREDIREKVKNELLKHKEKYIDELYNQIIYSIKSIFLRNKNIFFIFILIALYGLLSYLYTIVAIIAKIFIVMINKISKSKH